MSESPETSKVGPAERLFPAKDRAYYERDRRPFLEWLGDGRGRVLDIGCGSGLNATWLRDNGATRIVGIEIDEASAARAGLNLDLVHADRVERVVPLLDETFDLVLLLDVLEHLEDPWSVLDDLHRIVAPGGRIAISIPNIRYLAALWSIAFGRGFAYAEEGILDVTHLRFFTRSGIKRMLEVTGWAPERWGAPATRLKTIRNALAGLTRHRSNEWLAVQWFVVASPAKSKLRG